MSAPLQPTLPTSSYVSAESLELERERIFSTEWVCAGRVEELARPGDYAVKNVCEESILVVRTRQETLAAFYNVCRHRGCLLVLGDESSPERGRFPGAIRCPYHSWTYGLEGDLRGAPWLGGTEGFDKAAFSLRRVGIETWGGFVFICLAPEPRPALWAQIGERAARLSRYPLEDLRVGRTLEYEVAANWKVVLENYNECYHCSGVHPELCEIVPALRAGGAGLDWDEGIPHRPGAHTFTASGTTARRPFSGLSEAERGRHKADLFYPNLMLSLSPDHVVAFVLRPVAPGRTEISCSFLFEESETLRGGFDPSDAVDFWDLVNRQDWRVCEGVQRGMESRSFSSGYFAPMEDASLDIRRYVSERLESKPPS